MRFIFNLRDSAYIWQQASKAEARKNVLSEGRTVDSSHPIAEDYPTASKLLGESKLLPEDFHVSYEVSAVRAMAQRYGIAELSEGFVLKASQRRVRSQISNAVLPQAFRKSPLYELENGVYICSPESCFYYLCQTLPFEQAIMLGFEICGEFALDPAINGGFGKRKPLTTPSKLMELSSCSEKARGAKRFRAVTPWVLAGSESPKESMVGICLELPKRVGGYGLCQAIMNAAIPLGKQSRIIYPHKECRVDLLIPGTNLALEYDSTAEHSGDVARKKDARRQRALALEGIEVIPMAADVAASTLQMDGVAELVAARLGKTIECKVKDYAFKRADLQERLSGRTDWGI